MKKSLPLIGSLIAGILVLVFFINLGFKDKAVIRSTSDRTSRIQYALVNEDKGANFEDSWYALGTDFVTLINKDTTNQWEVTTRSAAISGVRNGQFDAFIIIPQDFSERLLALQTATPEKALIEYQVRDGQNEITNQAIQGKVNDILKDFNQRIIQMYFSSVIETLVEAQQNVNQIAGTQIDYQTKLENSIYTPFKEVPINFTSVLDTTSILDEDHKAFAIEQEAFVTSVQSLLDSNNSSLEMSGETIEGVKTSVGNYTEEANEKIEQSVDQFNQQFELQKEQLTEQWQKSTDDYRSQFEQLNATITNQFGDFYTVNEQKNSGVLANFLTEIKAFQDTQSTEIAELSTEIGNLQNQVKQLDELKKELALTYYNDENATPETATDEGTKQAIINLMTKESDDQSKLGEEYREVLEENLEKVPYDSLESLLDALVAEDVIDGNAAAVFYDELNIVKKYADDFEKPIGTSAQFAYLESPLTHDEIIDVPLQHVTFTINTDEDTTIVLQEDEEDRGTVAFDLDERVLRNMVDYLNRQLSAYNYQTSITGVTDTSFVISKPTEIVSEVDEGTTDDDKPVDDEENKETPKEPLLPDTISLTADLPVIWYLTETQQETSFNEIHYSWMVNGISQNTNQYAVYLPLYQPLLNDLPELLKQFQMLDITAQQIVTLFGNPNQSLSIQTYASMLEMPENKGKTIADLAEEQSIYRKYDNISNAEKQELVTDRLFEEYKKTGNKLYEDTEKQIADLQQVIGTENDQNTGGSTSTLYGALNMMTAPDQLLQEVQKLNGWFTQAQLQVNSAYESWGEADKIGPESIINENNPHPEPNDNQALSSEADSLVEMVQTLIQTSKETSAAMVDSAARVRDVAPAIEEIKESTTRVQDNANDILTELSLSIDESKKTVEETEGYAKTFDQVLANTKNGGTDNPQVFDFLSNPVQGNGVFGQTRQVSLVPYYATLIGAFLVLAIGIALQEFMRKRIITEDDVLADPTRIWQNVPNTLLVISVTALISMLYAGTLTVSSGVTHAVPWFVFAFLVFGSNFLLSVGLLRQFKKITIYVWAMILGLFFMLSPLLGIATKTGSLSNILYRISPLQNIQNGFTTLINGGKLSWVTYLMLVGLIFLGIIVNLLARPDNRTRSEKW